MLCDVQWVVATRLLPLLFSPLFLLSSFFEETEQRQARRQRQHTHEHTNRRKKIYTSKMWVINYHGQYKPGVVTQKRRSSVFSWLKRRQNINKETNTHTNNTSMGHRPTVNDMHELHDHDHASMAKGKGKGREKKGGVTMEGRHAACLFASCVHAETDTCYVFRVCRQCLVINTLTN